jgi:hypothetical protein
MRGDLGDQTGPRRNSTSVRDLIRRLPSPRAKGGRLHPAGPTVRSRLRSGRSMSGRLLYREHEQQGAIVMLLAMAGWQEWTAAGIVAAIFATVAVREYWGE